MTEQYFYTASQQTRLTEKSIQIAYSYLVDKLTLADTAKKHGVGKERVCQVVIKTKYRFS